MGINAPCRLSVNNAASQSESLSSGSYKCTKSSESHTGPVFLLRQHLWSDSSRTRVESLASPQVWRKEMVTFLVSMPMGSYTYQQLEPLAFLCQPCQPKYLPRHTVPLRYSCATSTATLHTASPIRIEKLNCHSLLVERDRFVVFKFSRTIQ